MIPRRSFLKLSAGAGASFGLGGLLDGKLPHVTAEEASLPKGMVQFHPDIEPLVRLLEDTPRDQAIEKVAERIRSGTSYREILAALFLAGVRNVQPRPVGFKFHAVLVVNSAHLASLASADSERWLPILWAIDQFKSSQEADVKQGDWTMASLDDSSLPPAHQARAAFITAMDAWDESAADNAVAALARTASTDDLFELFARYGSRDFRDIGHKAIYVANSFRCLEVIGWHHAEPVLRSLAYALLDRSGDGGNPAQSDFAADRPGRENLELVTTVRDHWWDGKPSADATRELLALTRQESSRDVSALVVKQLNDGVAPQSIFDALFCGAGELLMRAPGILALHAMTCTNALHYAWQRVRDDQTRKLILLQNAAFLPLFRGNRSGEGVRIDELEALPAQAGGNDAVAKIFADISSDRLAASREILGYLQANSDPRPFAETARRLIFLKGTNAHDYKFSSAVLEDYQHLSPPWRDYVLASSAFNLRGSGDKDSGLLERSRAALNA
ncbi:MAG: hypothetical protein ABI680_13150 [Chthoniobacteraceae bacterium]